MENLPISHANSDQHARLIDIATRNVIHLAPGDELGKAAHIMADMRISSLVVVDESGHPVGIVTERNMLHAMQSGCPPETPLQQVMSSPVITVPESMSCQEAYQICLRDNIRHLVIIDSDKLLLGVVSETDFRLHANLTALAGRRQVVSIMSLTVFSLPPAAHLHDALNLMQTNHDTCVVVVESERPVGIVTERDIVRLYSNDPMRTDIPISTVMSAPVLTIPLDNTINEAAERMLAAKVRHLAVVDHAGRMVGLISEHDLTRTLAINLLDGQKIAEGAFLHTLINTIPDLIWLKNVNGVFLACNQRYELFLGANEKDIIGKTDYDFVSPEQADSFREQDRQVVSSSLALVNEEPLTFAADGYCGLFETIRTPMLDSFGNIIGVLGIAHDISGRKRAEKLISDSENKYRTLVECAGDAIFLADAASGMIIDCNRNAARLIGKSKEEIIGLNQADLHPPEKLALYQKVFQEHIESGMGITEDVQIVHKDGHTIPVDIHASIFELDGTPVIVGVFRDITERKRTETEVRIAATAFESQQGMLVTDANSVILRINQAFTHITQYTAKDVVGKHTRVLNSGHQDADFYADMWNSIHRTGGWEGEIWNRRKSGETYPVYLTITAVKDPEGHVSNYVACLTDMTLSKSAEEEIKHLAFYDPLTSLPNRRLLLDRLRQALASSARNGREGALLFIDLDNFKVINDTHGHHTGDLLLQQVAQRLQRCVREGDTVARLGGDEFVVMLEDLSEHSIEAAAQSEFIGEKIIAALNLPYQLATHEFSSTPSIGVTLFNDHQQEIAELLKRADIAMYQAKKAGRNTLRFFDTKMQDTITARAELEAELRKALDHQQFHLYYQIQVDNLGKPDGAEALIRWIHPERGLVSPVQFIPLAEDTGLILAIGQWVLETACAQLNIWQQSAHTRDLVLAVNVSARQFRQSDFSDRIQAVVQKHAINPSQLKLELTESLLLENIEETIVTMNALKDIGVHLSLDDFGTGYSSLQYLKRLPLNQIKIDQSFVRDITIDASDKAIVLTIIAMAHGLNLDVIAEGVETIEQKQFLESSGCSHFQGYLFSKPVPIEQFELILKAD